ncbi:DNA repair protein RecO [Mucilaginibacter ginkgonis]|uniref:DNA repair protein RecO n=1 Tax=Mucilaginibacter ginkgonis TaxID=2682091 RepID=A0A6I4HXN3_9SPHI|nr:DNA repair protein RecO [Mucilaginibacter ginkgonis]QQL49267.1 DNA repair protein RecO [Mucilaginibacter ginkgonis]
MLHKTRGIVFKVTDYQEASVIVQLFTEKFGIQSYIINGVRKPKAKVTRNMLQPLHLLDLVVYHKTGGGVQRIKEIKSSPLLQTIPYDIVKSSIALFLNEVLYKAVKQQSPDEHLFHFVFNSIELLDHREDGLNNFHLVFLIRLSRYLGFYPHSLPGEKSIAYFDMINGVFSGNKPDGPFLPAEHARHFYDLLAAGYEHLSEIKLGNDERRYLLNRLLDYYSLHVEGFGNIKSNSVLEEILS